jgi:hypothetical protein
MRPLVALLVVAYVSGACATEGPGELVLVTRAWPHGNSRCSDAVCSFEGVDMSFRDGEGRTARLSGADTTWEINVVNEPEVECGDAMVRRLTYIYRFTIDWPDEPVPDELVLHDGSAFHLFPESFITVDYKCTETIGRWEGVEGAFAGRTGTYRSIDDFLQIKLVLTET